MKTDFGVIFALEKKRINRKKRVLLLLLFENSICFVKRH